MTLPSLSEVVVVAVAAGGKILVAMERERERPESWRRRRRRCPRSMRTRPMPTGWLGWAWSGMFGSLGESAWHVQVTAVWFKLLRCVLRVYVRALFSCVQY